VTSLIGTLAWLAAVFLMVRCICVLNRVKPSTWRKSAGLNVSLIGMAISSALAVFGPLYGETPTDLGHSSMVVCAALVCMLDKRHTWRERQERDYRMVAKNERT
jgi:hypothetical protein